MVFLFSFSWIIIDILPFIRHRLNIDLDVGAEPKVCDLHFSVHAEQHIVRL